MFNVILAKDIEGGIGINGKLPWHCSEELNIFKTRTTNNIIVVGRKTLEKLPYLKDREIWCLSKNKNLDLKVFKNNVRLFNYFEDIVDASRETDKKVFIAGGKTLYDMIFTKPQLIENLYLSIMNEKHKADTYVEIENISFIIKSKDKYNDFTHYKMVPRLNGEYKYLKLLKSVYNNGVEKIGRNGLTISSFGNHLEFNLLDGFPLLTTKKMFFRGIVEELLFFLRGDTDSKKLEDKNIKIWSGNTSKEFLKSIGKENRKEGFMGPMYGYQWRYYNSKYDENTGKPLEKGIDQLKKVIHLIKNDPSSRRILLTDYNPLQASDGVLYPCHSIIIQFYVYDKYLDMYCYNRSSDLFHGLPFNIASSALLLKIVASITNLIPRYFKLSLGDCHIYKEHFDVVSKQLKRFPYELPLLNIDKELETIKDIENLTFKDFSLIDYKYHSSLKANMVI